MVSRRAGGGAIGARHHRGAGLVWEQVLSGGGGTASSENFQMAFNLGQGQPVGTSSSPSYSVGLGFWQPSEALPPPPPPVLCKGQPSTIVGTPGDDTIPGTGGDDVISGLGGKDTIVGFGGNDLICGGPGKDSLNGGPGDDRLYGQGGR